MLPSLDSPRPLFTTPCRDMGIDALRRVTHEIVTNVQTLVGAPPPPASKYADLLLSLHTAFGQGFAIIGGLINASAPINRLPRELLTNVFALSPGPFIPHGALEKKLVYWPFKTETNVGDLHKLTKVCRYWRDLAIASSSLWTTIGTFQRDWVPFFRRSKYLQNNSSLALTIHLNTSSGNPPRDLLDFVLKNTPSIRVREFHAWDTASIQDHFSLLQKFDTGALEHCTLLGQNQRYGNHLPSNTKFLPFFPNGGGGARLRSLCLIYPGVLPANEFPALTLLMIADSIQSHITMEDLFRFLAGCPRLEEAYIYDIIPRRDPSPTSPTSPPPIALPRLQYLYYTYRQHQDSGWQEDMDPIEHLLSRISIPSTCHMFFTVGGTRERHYAGTHDRYDGTSSDILTSVSRHIHGKDAVSRIFLWLETRGASSMQFIFPQGSVRLQFGCQFTCVNTLRSLAPFLSQAEDVRVRYTSSQGSADLVRSLARTLPTTFPNLKVLSLIRQNAKTRDNPWAAPSSRSVDRIHLLHWYLVQTPRPSNPPAGPEADRARAPWHPKLDTLWVSVRSEKEIASLQKTLAGRAASGFPIRRVIVHHGFAGDSDSEALALLRALEEHAEEVMLMQTRASRFDSLREVDWAERLADRFELPAALREGWPTRWYETEGDAHHQIEEGSDSDLDLDLDSDSE